MGRNVRKYIDAPILSAFQSVFLKLHSIRASPHINLSGFSFLSPFPYAIPLTQVFSYLFFMLPLRHSSLFTILDELLRIHSHRLPSCLFLISDSGWF